MSNIVTKSITAANITAAVNAIPASKKAEKIFAGMIACDLIESLNYNEEPLTLKNIYNRALNGADNFRHACMGGCYLVSTWEIAEVILSKGEFKKFEKRENHNCEHWMERIVIKVCRAFSMIQSNLFILMKESE